MTFCMINNFSVSRDNIDELEGIISDITDSTVIFQEGFIESSLLRNSDSSQLTMVSKWRSPEDYNLMRENRTAAEAFSRALKISDFFSSTHSLVKTFRKS